MSRSKEIKELIWKLLEDGEIHTLEEIQNLCIEKEILDTEHLNIIRGVVFNLKKNNEEFETIGRGKYRRNINMDITVENKEIDCAIESIYKELEELKKINWITASDESLKNARKRVDKLKRLSDIIAQFINA